MEKSAANVGTPFCELGSWDATGSHRVDTLGDLLTHDCYARPWPNGLLSYPAIDSKKAENLTSLELNKAMMDGSTSLIKRAILSFKENS